MHSFLRACFLSSILVGAARADDATEAGALLVEHPTLENLGFQWAITGDANRNATVAVQYRAVGEAAWRPALPLLRIGGERVYRAREHLDYTVPDGFAGSVLGLNPDTEYECRLELTDPDGVKGEAVHAVKVRTRAEPKSFQGGRVLHVYPSDYKGTKQEPNFTSLLEAYYGAGLGDWSVVWERRAQPGDTILLHAGLYKSERRNYVDPMMTPFDGSMSLALKGTREKPITIKSAGDGEVIFDGDGNHRLFDVMASEHHIFEGLTIRNTDVGIFAGQKEVAGAVGLVVRNCRFEQVGLGVWTESANSRDFYIADNLFIGRDDRFRLIGWAAAGSPAVGAYGSHQVVSYYAIKVYGPGHVIARNAIAYFHDAIGISTYGTPEKDPERQPSSIDIYGNDIHLVNDNFVEADGGMHNIRVYGNRGINVSQGGYSAQPVFGGPVYFIRNLLYHVPSGVAFKFMGKPAGILVYHNTIIGEQVSRDPYPNAHFRNNLFLGRDTPNREIMSWAFATSAYSTDYNGYRPNRGVKEQYVWLAPAPGGTMYTPKPTDWRKFATLAELAAATGQEKHGVELDYDIFEHLVAPNPAQRHAVYHAMDLNFRLKPGSKAVDAGEVLPTVNDGFTGRAPDLGAMEVGAPEPKYGPRWITWQPFYR